MGADLGDSIDVQVQIGSSFPWSKAARQDLALNIITGDRAASVAPTLDLTKIARCSTSVAFRRSSPRRIRTRPK
jgi:hypothetical protein